MNLARCFVSPVGPARIVGLAAFVLAFALSACGGGDGARVRADPQGIVFDETPALAVGANAAVHASASSGLPVAYTSLTPATCSVDAAAGLVAGLGIGACTIAADQRGDERYAPAPQVRLYLAVSGRGQTIEFDAPPPLAVDATAALHARADSGLPLRYTSLTPAACSVDAATGVATGLAAGTCTIAADQPGDSEWAAAARATLNIVVDAKAQTIAFERLAPLQVGATTTAKAVAGSGLEVGFTSLTPAVCAVAGGVVTAIAAGTCTVAADQPGDARWASATRALQSTSVARAPQTVEFSAVPAALAVGATASLRAAAGSGLPVAYSSLSPTVCSIDAASGAVTGLAIGNCTVAADQPGNANWAPAAQSTRTIAVAGIVQTITFAAAPPLGAGGKATVRASASSGLAVAYSSLTPAICTIDASGLVSALKAGGCTIAADQRGDARFAPAAQATLALHAASAAQTIVFGAAPSLGVGATASIRASASSGLAVRYGSSTAAICSVDAASGAVTGLAIGTCRITADQPGDAVWAPAPQATQTLTVAGKPQTITFAAAPALTAGGTATVRASASSGLPVHYASLSPGLCTVDAVSGLVRSLAAGACTIAASQPGDASWAAAAQAVQTLGAAVAAQTIVFDAAPAALTVGGTLAVRASASSGLAVAYRSLTAAACSIDASGLVTGLAIGNCTVAADQPGNTSWAPAAQATRTIAVAGKLQTITFAAAPALTAGGTATVRASASSGLPVHYASLSPGLCTVDAVSGLVRSLAAGACTIAASQPGDASWAAAAQAVQTLGAAVAAQTIVFDAAPAALTVGGTLAVRASASSGLAVAYRSLTAAACSIDASGLVTGLAIGNCTVAADQPGNTSWAPAAQATRTIAVAGKLQTITFAAAPPLSAGGTATVRASASSGLPVRYASLSPGVCSVDPASGLVTAKAAGSCSIAADQPGDAQWAAATQALQTITVGAAAQTIAFGAVPASVTVGGSATIRASASSGLAVVYSSLSAANCSVQPDTGIVAGLAIGDCTVAARQPGDSDWLPAPQQSRTFAVAGKVQTIAFGAPPALTAGGSATVRAVASSGLAVVYGSLTPAVCTVGSTSGIVAGLAVGSCRIGADQPGDSTWAAAVQAVQTLAVGPDPNQTIAFAAVPTLTLGGTATVHASASSGLPVVYSSLSPGVCSVDAPTGRVESHTLGDCLVAADQPGDATYHAAPQATQTLPVQPPAGVTVPGVPQGVTARLGDDASTVVVAVGSVESGGSPITGYSVVSEPPGITASAAAAPVTVRCAGGCSGRAFAIAAANLVGSGEASAMVHVRTTFDVVTTFHEPDTQPRDSIFTGWFTLDSTTGAIVAAAGDLSESMTGNAVGSAPYYDMTRVPLTQLLQSWADPALAGSFVAVFRNASTATFSTMLGGDGWSPAAGIAVGGLYAGFPGANPGNAYALVFVPNDPFAALTPAQIDKLAYADCAPGGMMGAVCMTGTSIAGYGQTGTMSGYPVAQVLRRR